MEFSQDTQHDFRAILFEDILRSRPPMQLLLLRAAATIAAPRILKREFAALNRRCLTIFPGPFIIRRTIYASKTIFVRLFKDKNRREFVTIFSYSA